MPSRCAEGRLGPGLVGAGVRSSGELVFRSDRTPRTSGDDEAARAQPVGHRPVAGTSVVQRGLSGKSKNAVFEQSDDVADGDEVADPDPYHRDDQPIRFGHGVPEPGKGQQREEVFGEKARPTEGHEHVV